MTPDPFNQIPAAPEGAPRMIPSAIDQMMVYLLTDSEVNNAARQLLLPEHFVAEPQYRVMWRAMLSLVPGEYSLRQLPYDALMLRVEDMLQGDPAPGMTPRLRAVLVARPEDVGTALPGGPEDPAPPGGSWSAPPPVLRVEGPGLIHHVYHPAPDTPARDTTFGMSLLRRFLHERTVNDDARRRFDALGASDVDQMARILSEISTRLVRVRSIGSSVCFRPTEFPEDPEPIPIEATGVDFLDEVMDGGDAAGELNMLFGPQKAGKSFLGTQLATRKAELYCEYRRAGGEHREACFFSYEMAQARVTNRFYACGANVSLDELDKHIKSGVDYSRAGSLKPYEIEYYKAKQEYDFTRLPGERERISRFNASTGHHLATFDMTGFQARATGGGGIAEIVALLDQEASEGHTPGVVIIDYLGLMIEKQIAATGGDRDRLMRSMMLAAQIECFTRIAIPFRVPVWLIHQYSSDGQKAAPTKLLRTTDGSDAKTLGAAANFAFCLGMPDPETHTAQLLLDISRRSKGGQVRLIQRDAARGRWSDVNNAFYVDTVGDRILPNAASVAGDGMNANDRDKFRGGAAATVNPYAAEKQGRGKPDADYVG